MSISEESHSALSLDALLGVEDAVEELPAEPEVPTPAPVPAASLDLLSALGLVSVEPAAQEPASAEPKAATSATPALNLASLIGTTPDDSEPTVELQPEPKPDPALTTKPEPAPLRSRFADLPPFRSPEERTEPPTPKAPELPQKEPAKLEALTPTPKNAASPAVKYLVGESRPLALSEQCIDRVPAPDDSSSEAPKADDPASTSPSASHPSASVKPNPVESVTVQKPTPAPVPEPSSVPALAPTPAPEPMPAAKPSPAPSPKPVASKKQRPSVPTPATKPISASAPTPATSPAAVPQAAPQAPNPTARPQRPASPGKPAKRSGIWYLLGVCLFAIALACACYALYSSVASYAAPPLVPSETDAPTQAASRTFRYSVQGSDGTVRTVTEQVHLNVDGFVAETTISFNAESEAEATWFLDDAKAQFDDAWVSGSVQGTQAIFTLLPARTDLNAEAYEALLTSNITDFTVLQ